MDMPTNTEQQNQLALRVALQTMKERCMSLQRRLTTVEEENEQLREGGATDGGGMGSPPATTHGGAAENLQLRLQVAELNRQKTQLSEHLNMVSNENRKLWSRLSQLAKEQGKVLAASSPFKDGGGDCTLIAVDLAEDVGSPRCGGANQNLIRSKTFTQHSPNPNLRHTLISSDAEGGGCSELKDISLEEVTLGGGEAGASVEHYEEAELGFTYLNVVEEGGAATAMAAAGGVANEGDFNLEAKKCIEGLQDMRREAMKQRQALNSALTVLETKIALHPCPECAQKSQKPEMADKSLETDESAGEQQANFYNNSQIMQNTRRNFKEAGDNDFHLMKSPLAAPATSAISTPPQHLNVVQEKIEADALDKTCPMCGKIYSSLVTFNAFREHVEMHFIEDLGDVEASMERHFEYISHAVGDF